MNRPALPILSLFMVCAGCVTPESKTELVSPNPFTSSPITTTVNRVSYSPSSVRAAARVDSIGRKILVDVPQLGIKPMFRTIGAPESEVFHRGTTEVIITDGLVNQCANDGQLAAVLLLELAKMVGEREAAAGPRRGLAGRGAPLESPVGNDFGGSFGAADQVHRAELAKYELAMRKRAESASSFDPQALARVYLPTAGYAATDLDSVLPILNAASNNRSFAKQLGPVSMPIAPTTSQPTDRNAQ
jgi:hypothetical protein